MSMKYTKSLEDVGSWTFDVQKNRFHFSEKALELFQIKSAHDITYEKFLMLFEKEDQPFLDNHFQLLLSQNAPFVVECGIENHDEEERIVRLTGSSVEFDQDHTPVLSGVVRLYTNEVNTKFRESLVYSILDDLAIISITDASGVIIYANKKFCEVSGYSQSELLGQTHRIVKSGVHPKEFYQGLWKTVLQGNPWHGEVVNKSKSGELYYVEAHVYPRKNYKQEITEFISVRFDITEKKMREQDDLVKAKFQMVGETSAQIMHDVMNPLSIIQMALDLLDTQIERGQIVSQQTLTAKVKTMRDSTMRIRTIFSNMKDMLHNKSSVETMDVYECAYKALEICSLKLSKHKVKTEVKFERGQYYIDMNYQQLLQVFINMINNSSDAIEGLPDKWIRLEVKDKGDFFVLSLTDSGAGIDPAYHQKIFQSLFTTKDKDTGTGLGLPICKRILESYGGRIEIDAESPHTQFNIYLQKRLEMKKVA